MSRLPNVPCADCGTLMWAGKSSLPAGQARCQPCRRIRPTRIEVVCTWCGDKFTRKHSAQFCSQKCYAASIRTRPDTEQRVLRRHRESAAPGLSAKRRSRMLAKWMRQHKPCVYCGTLADTVDHVVPLVRGGTNYEGNLVPACRRCNSSKSGRMVIEWRTGRVLPKAVGNPNWKPKPKAEPKAKAEKQPHPCPMCQELTVRPKYCSAECGVERERRSVRDKYRRSHGLSVDTTQATSKWAHK